MSNVGGGEAAAANPGCSGGQCPQVTTVYMSSVFSICERCQFKEG